MTILNRPSVFVYEFICGGGNYQVDPLSPPRGSMLTEGRAMWRAVCKDLVAAGRVHVRTLWDARLSLEPLDQVQPIRVSSAAVEQAEFERLAADSDFTLVIAPETDDWLATRMRQASAAGTSVLGPTLELVVLASHKVRMAEFWRSRGIPTPATVLATKLEEIPAAWDDPLVVKPVDGAGSQDVHLVTRNDLRQHLERRTKVCVQPFHAGRPASVSVLAGKHQTVVLPPFWQWVEPPGFAYQGGEMIREPHLAQRAQQLVHRALAQLPGVSGYLGFDLLLHPEDPTQDCMIELNPRLTTSYLGLRALTNDNLAAAMIDLANGESVELTFGRGPVSFDPSGRIH